MQTNRAPGQSAFAIFKGSLYTQGPPDCFARGSHAQLSFRALIRLKVAVHEEIEIPDPQRAPRLVTELPARSRLL